MAALSIMHNNIFSYVRCTVQIWQASNQYIYYYKWQFILFENDETIQILICVKFFFKNRIGCSEVIKMLEKAFGMDVTMITRLYEQNSQFQKEDDEDNRRVEYPNTSITDGKMYKIKNVMISDQEYTIKVDAENLESLISRVK